MHLENVLDNNSDVLISPPTHLNNFQTIPDNIEYQQHIAYSELIKKPTNRIKPFITFSKFFALISIKRIISYELIPAHLRSPKNKEQISGLARTIIHNMVRKISPRKIIPACASSSGVQQKLQQQGVCVFNLDPTHFKAIEESATPLLKQLRSLRGGFSKEGRAFAESRTTLLKPENPDLFKAIETAFQESGILTGIAQYLGRPVQVVDINPQINDSSDDFWRRFFPDLQIEKPATAYCHRDASGGDVKVIVYLSDVQDENGPFSYILGSHRNRPNKLDNLIQEVNDSCGFSGTDYESRSSFAALPAFLQKKCAFGNDLTPASNVEQAIMKAEWKITANKGHAVIFDSKGIHRGGMVLNGERQVLTCVVG